jgi:polyhydroxyalkanoate synthesis regulator phasin
MSIAEKYFKEQMNSDEFKRAYLDEKTRLDIEYRLEELKRDIRTRKSRDELIEKVENLEKFVMGA